jgi:hypothetical protein
MDFGGNITYMYMLPILVAALSKTWFCMQSPVEILGSNPAWAYMSARCECSVLSGSGLYVRLITRPEESYRSWCVQYGHKASIMRRPWPTNGCSAMGVKAYLFIHALK